MDWTSPSSYATASTTLDSLVATVATRHLHEAFVEVAVLLELAREARGPIAVRDRIERSVEAMTAYVAVHDELSRLRRGDRPLPVVATLEAVCEAHRGVPGVEDGVRFEAADATVKALAEPAAVWVASVALGEMVRELSRRGPVRVSVDVQGGAVTILATAPATRLTRWERRSTPTIPLLRRLAEALGATMVRRSVGHRIMLGLTIPTTPARRLESQR